MLPDPEHPQAAEVLAFALAYPEAWQDFPWGDRALKVKKKVFVFMGLSSDRPETAGEPPTFGVTVKVPESAPFLVAAGEATPTGYGLGKSGWVSMRFPLKATDTLPLARLKALIDESYRNVAPKTLLKQLGAPVVDDGE